MKRPQPLSVESSTKTEAFVDDALIAAIDVGSNAMRLGIAALDEKGSPKMVMRHREAVRLGHDAFTAGVFGEPTMQEALRAFEHFRRLLDHHHVHRLRAVATSAVREAANGRELVARIKEHTGIQIDTISGEEEARLIHSSVARNIDLRDRFVLCIDIGGGSVEVTLCDDGEAISSQSFKIGTVRLLELLRHGDDFPRLLQEYLDGTRKKLREQIGSRKPDFCIGTGGNASAIGELAHSLLHTESAQSIRRRDLKHLIQRLSSMDVATRIRKLGLRPDRADVILPAAMVFLELMMLSRTTWLHLPEASLLDGLLLDMTASPEYRLRSRRRTLLAWARSLKAKYHVDQHYAETIVRLALSLFDQLTPLHRMDHRDRLLLEVAARVHEIGMYIRVGGHHRHAAYLIMAAPLLGLSDDEKRLLAQTVRYHRKAWPSHEHEGFRELSPEQQRKVWVLSAMLRLAIALNKERRDRVQHVHVDIGPRHLSLKLEGHGDMLLERWAVLRVRDYVRKALGLKLRLED
ncbi:MAG: Ppx/GppA family phosphatase [Zetaproteobacteria bacterium]|nr:MAG: Ppx/GppA family phosphatase [Zetaproteobacteria bacterium]